MNCDTKYLCNPCYAYFGDNGCFGISKKDCLKMIKGHINSLRRLVKLHEYTNITNEYVFNQFVKVENGPKKSAIIDLFKMEVYHVENEILTDFNRKNYQKILPFLRDAIEKGIIIRTSKNMWIPHIEEEFINGNRKKFSDIIVNIEYDLDIKIIENIISLFPIIKIIIWGAPDTKRNQILLDIPCDYISGYECAYKKINKIDPGETFVINKHFYLYSKLFHNCWGNNFAVTKSGIVKPCLQSSIIIGDLGDLFQNKLQDKIVSYWELTKDKIETCSVCEFRRICPDCRVNSMDKCSESIIKKPDYCSYDPYTGLW